MDKYILGTLQELDAPKVGQLAHSTALGNYMTGFTKAMQQKLRADAIAADAKAIRAKAALAKALYLHRWQQRKDKGRQGAV